MLIAPRLVTSIKEKVEEVIEKVKSYDDNRGFGGREREAILSRIQSFNHKTENSKIIIGAVDSNGDFPSVSYLDSYIYWVVAQAAIYATDPKSGLKEMEPLDGSFHLAWIPGQEEEKDHSLDTSFNELSGAGLWTVVGNSDYREIKAVESGKSISVEALIHGLIRPQASDSNNIGIQLKHTAELGTVVKMLSSDVILDYILMEGTFSLPYAPSSSSSLFFEHLKRYCLVLAREKGVGFFSISRFIDFPFLSELEDLAAEKLSRQVGRGAEHWYLRLPISREDEWYLPGMGERSIPPPATVTYVFRLHRNLPIMRLDMDLEYWKGKIKRERDDDTINREREIFEDLDYASHDQRSFGYPYPLKAVESRVSLSKSERELIRKQIIAAGVKRGLERKRFI